MAFQDYNYYHCCFNWFNVKDGAIFIGICEIIAAILDVLLMWINGYFSSGKNVNWIMIAFGVGPLILVPIIVALMFFGIFKRRACLILPHLFMQVLFIVILLVAGFLWLIGMAATRHVLESAPEFDEPINSKKSWLIILVYVLTLIIELWFLRVVYKCFLYIQNKFY